MFNPILENYPIDYEGLLIRTSFRVGINIMACSEDPDFDMYSKIPYMLETLYGKGIPGPDIALRGLMWYLSGGTIESIEDMRHDADEDSMEKAMDFIVDSSRLFSAFKRTYNIDLSKADMHWFEFLNLLADIPEDTVFKQVVTCRTRKIDSKLPQETQKFYQKMKAKYSLTNGFSNKNFTT